MTRLMHAATVFALFFAGSIASAADVTEQQWVRANGDGTVSGRVVVPRSGGISAARGAKVSLITPDGKYAADPVKSDKTGRFVLSNVVPGVYTLMVQGDNSFACCAMHVVNSNVPVRSEIEIAAGAVDASVAQSAMVRYLPQNQSGVIEFDPSVNPLATDRVLAGEVLRVSQVDGGLQGRLTKAGFGEELGAAGSNVLVYKDGVEVARTVTTATGDFSIEELAPGSYSVLGSGQDGFGLMGLELIDPLTMQTVAKATETSSLVAQVQSIPETFVMQVAPLPGPIDVISDELIDEEIVDAGIPIDGTTPIYDGFGGGSFGGPVGGGGGIGGGGSLRGIGLLGGVGAAIAIAVADDDDTLIPPPVASPITP